MREGVGEGGECVQGMREMKKVSESAERERDTSTDLIYLHVSFVIPLHEDRLR